MESLMTVKEACELLRVCSRTLRELELRGQLKATRLGRAKRYKREEIARLVERKTR